MKATPFPSLTLDGWILSEPPEQACRVFATATSYAPQPDCKQEVHVRFHLSQFVRR